MTNRPKQCDYWWADGDCCGLAKGHEGNHAVFGPKCGAVGPSGVTCTQERHHRYNHRVTVEWENDHSETFLNGFLDGPSDAIRNREGP